MANKALATRQKMQFRIKPIKPRNPVAVAANLRVAGAHRKDAAALRQAAKQALKKIDPEADDT